MQHNQVLWQKLSPYPPKVDPAELILKSLKFWLVRPLGEIQEGQQMFWHQFQFYHLVLKIYHGILNVDNLNYLLLSPPYQLHHLGMLEKEIPLAFLSNQDNFHC